MLKKGKTRMLSLALTAAMTVGCMAGCGSSSSSATATSAAASSTAAAGAASSASAGASATAGKLDTSKEVDLVMYVVSDRPAGQDVVDENLNKLLKEKLNCTLKINWIGWAEYANKYPLLFSSGEQFDMAYSATWLNFANLARKGAFKSLNDLWPTYAPDNFAMQSDAAKQQATIDGQYYCVPTLLSTYTAYGPMYRPDLAGSDWDGKMETFDDIEKYCDSVKAAHPEVEPIDMYSSGPETFLLWEENKGMEYVDNGARFMWYDTSAANPKVIASYDEPTVTDFLTMMDRWCQKGFWSMSALSDTDSTKTQNGKAALKIHNIDTWAGLTVQQPTWNFKYANMVKDVAHLPYTQDCMVISNTSQNPERAMALWNLLTTDQEVYDAFYYGVLGTTYTLNDSGQFTITDPNLYSTSAMWAVRTNKLNRNQAGVPEEYNTVRQDWESKIKAGQGAEKYTSFVFDSTNVTTELAACQNVEQQYWWPLALGYTDATSGLADYKAKMQAAGIDKVVAEAQKQLDAYVAAQGK
ncbi:MAG: ABC transporter substrate-binding protein [Lachnospiraceae bacterium]|jgi:putative aldouronate transport system substrate-binding protein|nr:ABC transporter substrate-binding protein [Lachnospiraceae bacterium]